MVLPSWIPLNSAELLLILIAGAGLTLIISNRLRPDLVALLVLLGLGISRVLTAQQALGGFSNTAVMTIVGLFVITAALEQTGVVGWLADRLARLSGHTETRMIAVFMGAGALLSLVMNNIAAGAVLLPAAVRVARMAHGPPSKVLLPLSFGTLLGGMATLFTTANIILSGNLRAQNLPSLTMLSFLPTGGMMVLTGLAYMLLIGRRLLPAHESAARESLPPPDLSTTYQLAERLWELQVQPDSPLIGRTLAESAIGTHTGATVLALWHGRDALLTPTPQTTLAAHDLLLVVGREDALRSLSAQGLTLGRGDSEDLHTLPVQLTEAVIGPRAPMIGHTLKQLQFRAKFGLTAIALWREGRSYRSNVGDFALEAGDALLLIGAPSRTKTLAAEPGFIVLDHTQTQTIVSGKARWAAAITGSVLLLAALGIVPTAEAMLAGAAALVLTGCLSMEDAYRAIEWRVVVLIAGMLPIGTALVQTGLGDRIGTVITAGFAHAGPLVLLVGLYLITILLTQVVGGQVAALIVGPIAVSIAMHTGINPQALAVAVAMACSVAFLTPIAHPVNILMMGPGGYTPRDFVRVGLGQTLVCILTLIVVMPLFWKL